MEVSCEVSRIPYDRGSDPDWLRNDTVTNAVSFPVVNSVAITITISI
jgi:hypothetical protein